MHLLDRQLSPPGGDRLYRQAKGAGRASVLTAMRRRFPDSPSPLIVHRLDMATSGLMIIAKTMQAYHDLQRQFANHEIRKRYVAVLSRPLPDDTPKEGRVSLSIRPDLDDRPRQIVDKEHGTLKCHYCEKEQDITKVSLI